MNIDSILNLGIKTSGLSDFIAKSISETKGNLIILERNRLEKENHDLQIFKLFLREFNDWIILGNEINEVKSWSNDIEMAIIHEKVENYLNSLRNLLNSKLNFLCDYGLELDIAKFIQSKFKEVFDTLNTIGTKVIKSKLNPKEFPVLGYSKSLEDLDLELKLILNVLLSMKTFAFGILISDKNENIEFPDLITKYIIEPIELLLHNHFIEQKTSTNKIDKPEWFFNLLLHLINRNSELLNLSSSHEKIGKHKLEEEIEIRLQSILIVKEENLDLLRKLEFEDLEYSKDHFKPAQITNFKDLLVSSLIKVIKSKFLFEQIYLNSDKNLLFHFVNQTYVFISNLECEIPIFEKLFDFHELQGLLCFEKDTILRACKKMEEIESIVLLFKHFFAKYTSIRNPIELLNIRKFFYAEILIPSLHSLLNSKSDLDSISIALQLFNETCEIWKKNFDIEFQEFMKKCSSEILKPYLLSSKRFLKSLTKSQRFLNTFTLDHSSLNLQDIEQFVEDISYRDYPIFCNEEIKEAELLFSKASKELENFPLLSQLLGKEIELNFEKEIFEQILIDYKFTLLGLENMLNFFIFIFSNILFSGEFMKKLIALKAVCLGNEVIEISNKNMISELTELNSRINIIS